MAPEALRALLPRLWSAESSTLWQPDNPARGQCGATALLAQELCGGDLLKTRCGAAWHFYNRIGGVRHDLTDSQFSMPPHYEDRPCDPAEAQADATPAQHAALRAAWIRCLGARP